MYAGTKAATEDGVVILDQALFWDLGVVEILLATAVTTVGLCGVLVLSSDIWDNYFL